MDDFLYILIGIAWVAYSFYRNKQKQESRKAAAEGKRVNVPNETPPVRNILREILMEDKRSESKSFEKEYEESETDYLPENEARSSEVIKTEAESLEVITDEVPADYFDKEYLNRDKARKILGEVDNEADQEIEESGFEIARDFDLKSAVIYTEILNPRHF